MASRHHIDDFYALRSIGKIEERRKITDVARGSSTSLTALFHLAVKSFKTTGMCSRRNGGSRVRSTTTAEDRYIVLSAKRNRRITAQQVGKSVSCCLGKQISQKTVARRLRRGGGTALRMQSLLCVPIDQTAPYCPFAMVS
ncbi:hypothetical protein TNCV_267081 [Trichonephila clavipes]|nr:hypothetical protein TNCV_267081 [Trichonephila clavipes]